MKRFSRSLPKTLAAILLAAACVFGLAAAGAALAQAPTADFGINYGSYTGLSGTDIRITIAKIIRTALGLLGIVAILIVLYGGFTWMTAAGEAEKVERAKKILSAGVIGLLIIVSSFAIASWVLNALVEATSGGSSQNGGGGPGGGFGGGGNGFHPSAIQPSGTLHKRDVVANITFNAAPTGDVSNIKANILLEKLSGGTRTPVNYDPTVVRNSIHLVPTEPCPDPNADRKCLDADSDYSITINSGLKNSTGDATVVCGFGSACTQRFHTGTEVATAPPTARITNPTEGQSVQAGSFVQVQSLLTDENGIGNVDYLANGAFYQADGAVSSLGGNNYSSQVSWDTTAFTPVANVSLGAEVTNIDGDTGAAPAVGVVVRPAHCFNSTKDADETGPDCGGADCGACSGGACTSNAQCASGECVGGICVEKPKIVDVQLRDGKPGNLVTITGEHFGTSAGHVVFLGGNGTTDDKEAALASCSGAWGDSRIIVSVPDGAVSGPIEVTTAANKNDATNDLYGPVIPDFVINAIARPGICSITPSAAKTRDALTVGGVGFGPAQNTSTVLFAKAGGDCVAVAPPESYDAGNVAPWTDVSMQPKVPNVSYGSNGTNYLVHVEVGGQPSNPVCMLVLPPEAGTLPHVDRIAPSSGSPGTYVTLFGSNFGSNGQVKFVKGGQIAYGDTSFPQQCSTGYWNTDSVIVKVPAKYTTPADVAVAVGDHAVNVVRSDSAESNVVTFTVNTAPVPPGLCGIDPKSGPANVGVSLYGEHFGQVGPNDLNTLLLAHPDAVQFFDTKNATSLGRWVEPQITTSVPAGAKTGPVTIKLYPSGGPVTSNGVNFEVKDCRQSDGDTGCAAGNTCCPDGACRAAGSCAAATIAGGYAWQFSTGPIPVYPVVIQDATCQLADPVTMPSPNPYKGAEDVCTDIGGIAMRFSLPMDVTSFNSSNVQLQSCGTGAAAGPCVAVQSAPVLSLTNFGVGTNNMLTLGVNGLAASTWYKVTLKSTATVGLKSRSAVGRPSEALDGDYDGKGGGDYVTTFKTGTGACVIAAVDVQPDKELIDTPAPIPPANRFDAYPLSDRCIILQCSNRDVTWSSSDTSEATLNPTHATGACTTLATPIAETVPGPDDGIRGVVDAKGDTSLLKVDYADPRVIDYGPHDCTEACPNTLPFALFNIPMKTTGLGSVFTAVHLWRCVNESCLSFAGGEIPLSASFDQNNPLFLRLNHVDLAANTYYRLIISGSAKSTAGAKLTGLNFNDDSFSWTFRTRTDGNPCGPQKIVIDPAQTTMHYIGQISTVRANALTSPDSCSATGQLLTDGSFSWDWTKNQSPASPEAFTYGPYPPPAPQTLLDTNPVLSAGCSSQCLYTGSMPPGTPVCGDGSVEQQAEACDTPGASGCTSRCLRAGNSVGNGCGDGVVQPDRGEECDAGNKNGDGKSGCSADCRLTGSVPGVSVCGNGSVGVGEACDDGNKESGDGCSADCLLEGSDQNIPVCGDGVLEAGEECDYTGPADSVTGLLVRNQTILLGQGDEHDSRKATFACTRQCLMSGNPSSGTAGPGLCGNGVIDSAKGENCDAGADNGKAGSGCSTLCTKTGSDPQMDAFCGDTRVTTKLPQGQIAEGGGEECEAGGVDSKIDPYQALTAKAQCDARNNCTASVTAKVQSVTGDGAVSVECSCQVDSDCTIFDSTLACGAGACCYKRPGAPVIQPAADNQCRNALVTIDFPEEMNQGSLSGNIFVVQGDATCATALLKAASSGPIGALAQAWDSVKRFFASLVGQAQAAACAPVTGFFTHSTLTQPDGTKRTHTTFAPSAAYDAQTRYTVIVKGGANGVKTATGVGYSGTNAGVQSFKTGDDICAIDVMQVTPAAQLVDSSSQPYSFVGQAMTQRGGLLLPIAPIPNFYDWSVNWSIVENDISQKGKLLTFSPAPGPNAPAVDLTAPFGKDGQAQLAATALVTANTAFPAGSKDSGTGTQQVGISDVTVLLCEHPWPSRQLDGTWAPYTDPATHFKFYYCRDNGAADLLPALKEPQAGVQPIQAKVTFSSGILHFCKTTKELGAPTQPKACAVDADCGGGDTCLSKDSLFLFDDPKIRDAVGVRVYANDDHVQPKEWFDAQHFAGSPTDTNVDGYKAIQDQRTVYVTAADKYGDPTLESRVYVFGYNDKADPRTVTIFNQITSHVFFNTNLTTSQSLVNVCKQPIGGGKPDLVIESSTGTPVTCSSDLDCFTGLTSPPPGVYCDAPKDKLRRDLIRWQSLISMAESLEDVRNTSGNYPKIDSGSFVRGMTVSKWPSWTQQLGEAGKFSDPLNAFNDCAAFGSECSVSHAGCASDAECHGGPDDKCVLKYAADTCFDQRVGLYLCPAASHVFRYSSIGGVDYRINAEFEYAAQQWSDRCAGINSDFSCATKPGCHWDDVHLTCLSRFVTTQECAGLPASGNVCLGTAHPCTGDGDCAPGVTCQPASSKLFGAAAGDTRCGNGIVEGSEECEIGQVQTVACSACPMGQPIGECGNGSKEQTCDTSCHWKTTNQCAAPAVCGNGALEVVAPNVTESCDDGAQNGQYGKCRSGSTGKGCAKRCIRDTQRVSFNPADYPANPSGDIGPSCVSNGDCGAGFVCTDRYQFCGDGVKNGSEACDDGDQNGQYGKCAWDCGGPGPRCGDLQVNGAEECDGTGKTSAGICSGGPIADNVGAPSTDVPCSKDSDCGQGQTCRICANTVGGLPQTRVQSCKPANPGGIVNPTVPNDMCGFAGWSVCRPSGACGNGKIEGSEQCDAGTSNSETGACLPTCKKNACGDGFKLQGVEQCDNGAQNGVLCSPVYGSTCSYCQNDCTTKTLSGAYCGDSSTSLGGKTFHAVDNPPETCDPGAISSWCSNTYTPGGALTPYGTLQSPTSGPKVCHTDGDCAVGICKNYVGGATGAACHTAADCTSVQYCSGGDGACISYNTRCTPDPYSNTVGTPQNNTAYHDGSCLTCSNQCAADKVKSPKYCGDGFFEAEYGEICEAQGDLNATGKTGSFYGCLPNCTFDPASGYCGDGIIQSSGNAHEACDPGNGNAVFNGPQPSCSSMGWGTAGATDCGPTCAVYGGGCSDGDLSPGDVRVRVTWQNPPATNDIDTHMKLPTSGGSQEIYYSNKGDVGIDPHTWLSWDDTTASHGDNAVRDGYTGAYGMEIMTINWRKNGAYWPSTVSDPYKFFLYQYSGGNGGLTGAKVTVCTYQSGQPKNANCTKTYTVAGNGGQRYWYVFKMYGSTDLVPTIVDVNALQGSAP